MLNILLNGLQETNFCSVCEKETMHTMKLLNLTPESIRWQETCQTCRKEHPNKIGYTEYSMDMKHLRQFVSENKILDETYIKN